MNAQLYSEQLERLAEAIQEGDPNRRHKVILLHDNARPHTAKITKAKLQELGFEILSHPPYSPDLAPSDFHLFRSLANVLMGQIFEDEDELESWLDEWIAGKSADFFKRGIEKLPERWEEVINSGGEYIED